MIIYDVKEKKIINDDDTFYILEAINILKLLFFIKILFIKGEERDLNSWAESN